MSDLMQLEEELVEAQELTALIRLRIKALKGEERQSKKKAWKNEWVALLMLVSEGRSYRSAAESCGASPFGVADKVWKAWKRCYPGHYQEWAASARVHGLAKTLRERPPHLEISSPPESRGAGTGK